MISQHYVFISLSALITLYQFFPRSSGLGTPSLHTHLHIPLPTQAGTAVRAVGEQNQVEFISTHPSRPRVKQESCQSVTFWVNGWTKVKNYSLEC